MSQEKLLAMAREAGRAGESYSRWTASDAVQDLVFAVDCDVDTAPIEAAFAEGAREWRIANGWRVMWTTAPSDYDGFGTETIAIDGEWYGKPLRRILIDPHYVTYQSNRNGSGNHRTWEIDPRIEEAQARERRERMDRERIEREAKHVAGLEWLKTATDDELEDFDLFESKGVRFADVRVEKERRVKENASQAVAAEWSRCLALISEGATLIDDGEPSKRGQYGVIPGRDPHVYYAVRIVHGWPDDADHANVMGEGNENAGSVSYVADWIASGRLRVATPVDAIPPHAVLKRIGQDRVRDVCRVRVYDRTVWVGRPRWGAEALVLDDNGHLVRSKKIRDAALASA